MRLVPSPSSTDLSPDESESIYVSPETLESLVRLAQALHCDMPPAIGVPALIRAILDRLIASGTGLGEAATEAELRRAAGELLMSLVASDRQR